ncbi:hypothetical protein AM587_10006334 [Phytophthora nicotianae]|uniref:Uncharacterized protein n=1 Tax=Phytophthora nicotianae TaxID=4792 RepID=A0A0W8CFK4_PHYNI|nr:hypothetical protein AM587_10006334 [Phytophthora nicotianae]
MPAIKSTAPCGGCGESVGSVHRCPTCSCHMHLFCGRPIGDEGFGQSVVCPGCEGSGGASSNTSEIVLATNTVTNAIESLDSDSNIKPDFDAIHSDLKFFPPNATDLCQPADSFVISKIKDAWKAKWNEKKLEFIRDNRWQNKIRKDGSWSGKLQNPGKRFFLQLAADAVKAVNLQKDKKGMSYARKAMIRCGLSLGIDGTWSIDQLYPHLREIISKHRAHFDGEVVVNNSET